MYIAYTTMWSEGVVVAHHTDKGFAIGSDPYSGEILYKPSLLDFEHDVVTIIEDDKVSDAVELDSALYSRKFIDNEEGKKYREMLTNSLVKAIYKQ